jgi:hypothetical protein
MKQITDNYIRIATEHKAELCLANNVRREVDHDIWRKTWFLLIEQMRVGLTVNRNL